MIQREDYLKGRVSHEEYYGQFVDVGLKQTLMGYFGVNRLIDAFQSNVNFNNIPLWKWDSLALSTQLWGKDFRKMAREAGEQISISFRVNILKEAARQVVREYQYANQVVAGEDTTVVLL